MTSLRYFCVYKYIVICHCCSEIKDIQFSEIPKVEGVTTNIIIVATAVTISHICAIMNNFALSGTFSALA